MPAWLQRSGLLQAPYLSPWRLRLVRLRQTAAPSLKSGSDEAFWDFGGTGEQRLPVEPSGGQGIDEQVERLGWSGVAGLADVHGGHRVGGVGQQQPAGSYSPMSSIARTACSPITTSTRWRRKKPPGSHS